MGATSQLRELSRRLVERAGPRVLKTNLSTLTKNLSDPLVINIISEMADGTRAATLGELLESSTAQRLAPPVGGVLWKQLDGALSAWADRERHRWPQQRGTAMAAGVSEPPEGLASVQRWATRYGVSECLDHPIRNLLPWVKESGIASMIGSTGEGNVRHCLDGDPLGRRFRSMAFGESLKTAARAYLWYCAGRKQVQDSRDRLWSRRLELPLLRTFSRLLRQHLRRMLAMPGVDVPVVFTEAPMQVVHEPPSVTIEFRAQDEAIEPPIFAELSFAGLDRGRVDLYCSCTLGNTGGCAHRRVLLEWTLDALHDRSDPMHAELVEVAGQPGWKRLVKALRRGHESTSKRQSDSESQLVWRIGGQGRDVVVQPVVRSRTKTGRWGRGRAVSVSQGLEEGGEIVGVEDRKILASLAVAEQASRARRGREFRAIGVEALVGHPRVFSLENPTRPMVVERVKPLVVFVNTSDGYRLSLRFGGRNVSPESIADFRLDEHHFVVVDDEGGRCFIATLSAAPVALIKALERYRVPLQRESYSAILDALAPYQPDIELSVPSELRGTLRPASETILLRLEPLSSGGLEASLWVRPAEGTKAAWPPGIGPDAVFGHHEGERFCAQRDLEQEHQRAQELVAKLGLSKARTVEAFRWSFEDQEKALELVVTARELGDELPIEWPEKTGAWKIGRVGGSGAAIRVRVRREVDWFSVEGTAELDDDSISLEMLLAAARNGARYVQLGPGRFARIESSLRERLTRADALLFSPSRKGLALGTALVEPAMELLEEVGELDADQAWHELRAKIAESRDIQFTVPEELEATLRGYQVEGFRWLARLAHWESGGCLADDMGLGKTIQSLALFLHRASLGPALVIAPTSVEGGWVAELQRFAPTLRPVVYRGPERRSLLRTLGPGDVVITSYDLLALDVELLETRLFATLVFDEAQAIKNPQTRRARAACRLRALFKFALTGTPIENHLGELWSIYHAINPGLFGSWEHFSSRFAGPIERDGDQERRLELARLLRPFLLRRLKAQVAPELPSRSEVVTPVELSEEERRIYDRARRRALESLTGKDRPNERQRRFAVLAAITRLRQLACHPRLLDPDSDVPSSKLFTALKIIENGVEQEQRALVFSQFTGHLALLREALDFRRIPFLYLDGKTPAARRKKLVEAWHDNEAPLFLISLKAGGTGLNLAGADMVIHLDPWWNPAVEDQATDRSHRIGQDRPLTVVRLISQQTIEEAVLSLHERKRELARGLLEGTDVASSLSVDDLQALILWGQEGASGDELGVLTPVPTPVPTPSLKPLPKAASDDDESTNVELVRSPSVALARRGRGAHLLSAEAFSELVSQFLEHLEHERERDLIKTDTTVAVYRRAALRFDHFVSIAAARDVDERPQSLTEWGELYLSALQNKEFEAPSSEPTIARTVVRRMKKFQARLSRR